MFRRSAASHTAFHSDWENLIERWKRGFAIDSLRRWSKIVSVPAWQRGTSRLGIGSTARLRRPPECLGGLIMILAVSHHTPAGAKFGRMRDAIHRNAYGR